MDNEYCGRRYLPHTGFDMNNGMPPRCRNQREPTACDTPTASAALSLVIPVAICTQNWRSTSRRSEGAPGDRIASLPVNCFIHPAGRPINTSWLKVLRRPVESALAALVGMVNDAFGFALLQRHVQGREHQVGGPALTHGPAHPTPAPDRGTPSRSVRRSCRPPTAGSDLWRGNAG